MCSSVCVLGEFWLPLSTFNSEIWVPLKLKVFIHFIMFNLITSFANICWFDLLKVVFKMVLKFF